MNHNHDAIVNNNNVIHLGVGRDAAGDHLPGIVGAGIQFVQQNHPNAGAAVDDHHQEGNGNGEVDLDDEDDDNDNDDDDDDDDDDDVGDDDVVEEDEIDIENNNAVDGRNNNDNNNRNINHRRRNQGILNNNDAAVAIEADVGGMNVDDNQGDNNNDNNNESGIIDGGVAGANNDSGKVPDIVLFLTWKDTEPYSANHPILRPNICVQIGLDKICKLNAVFQRYVSVCNEHAALANAKSYTGNTNKINYGSNKKNNPLKHPANIDVSDLEFVHCSTLSGQDTAENAALMKNDHIAVRRERSLERAREEIDWNHQRESDRLYFEQLRCLVLPTIRNDGSSSTPASSTAVNSSRIDKSSTSATSGNKNANMNNTSTSLGTTSNETNAPKIEASLTLSPYSEYADVLIHCDGFSSSNNTNYSTSSPNFLPRYRFSNNNSDGSNSGIRALLGNNTVSISTPFCRNFPCHSMIVSKRCPWLGALIRQAKDAKQQRQLREAKEKEEQERSRQKQLQNYRQIQQHQNIIEDPRQSVVTVPDMTDSGQDIGFNKDGTKDNRTEDDDGDAAKLHHQSVVGDHLRWNHVDEDNNVAFVPHNNNGHDIDRDNDRTNNHHVEEEGDVVGGRGNNNNNNNNAGVVADDGDRGRGRAFPAAAHVAESEDDDDVDDDMDGNQNRNYLGSRSSSVACGDTDNANNIKGSIVSNNKDPMSAMMNEKVDSALTRNAAAEAIAEAIAEAAAGLRLTFVSIRNHPPEAMALLLEFCYTNRVVPLGCDAFEQSCRTRRSSLSSRKNHVPFLPTWPVPPYPFPGNESSGNIGTSGGSGSKWPNGGAPLVTFDVAIAGIALAEEAGLHRLSLMCEIAASQLIHSYRFAIEALEKCEHHRKLHQNPLPRLRKAATYFVLQSMARSNRSVKNETDRAFREWESARNLVVPIFSGILEVIEESNKHESNLSSLGISSKSKKKFAALLSSLHQRHHPDAFNHYQNHGPHDWRLGNDKLNELFDKIDRNEAAERELERRKRRLEYRPSVGRKQNNKSNKYPKRQSGTIGAGSIRTLNRILLTSDDPDGNISEQEDPMSSSFGNQFQYNDLSHNHDDNTTGSTTLGASIVARTMQRMAAHHNHHFIALSTQQQLQQKRGEMMMTISSSTTNQAQQQATAPSSTNKEGSTDATTANSSRRSGNNNNTTKQNSREQS